MFEVNEKNNVALDSEHYDGETLKDVYGAVDEDVLAALASKDVTQEKLIAAVKARL